MSNVQTADKKVQLFKRKHVPWCLVVISLEWVVGPSKLKEISRQSSWSLSSRTPEEAS